MSSYLSPQFKYDISYVHFQTISVYKIKACSLKRPKMFAADNYNSLFQVLR